MILVPCLIPSLEIKKRTYCSVRELYFCCIPWEDPKILGACLITEMKQSTMCPPYFLVFLTFHSSCVVVGPACPFCFHVPKTCPKQRLAAAIKNQSSTKSSPRSQNDLTTCTMPALALAGAVAVDPWVGIWCICNQISGLRAFLCADALWVSLEPQICSKCSAFGEIVAVASGWKFVMLEQERKVGKGR